MILSTEQNRIIDEALNGRNILVDACIGSGKTTVIQSICNRIKNKNILYLTYNKLLKLDAKSKIKGRNVIVQNYHGLAWQYLKQNGINVAQSILVQSFIKYADKLNVGIFDILIIDEYQDIEQEFADMLYIIKSRNENMQIIAVGDMEQKIYDRTRLEANKFIREFLGDYIQLELTNCFRISPSLAYRLGNIWNKDINGVNKNCIVSYMSIEDAIRFLAQQKCKDILCLGMRGGSLAYTLNELEMRYPKKFNKNTVYASIRNNDSIGANPRKNSAIFTTYDGSKGMERDTCVVFDWTEGYWGIRINKPDSRHEILRNVFCVAASRGKKNIIFIDYENDESLRDETLKNNRELRNEYSFFAVSEMFEHKYREDVEECFNLLETEKIEGLNDASVIEVKSRDGNIDLSPCIGILQEVSYFNNYDIDKEIEWYSEIYKAHRKPFRLKENATIDEKVLYMVALNTNHDRYMVQVDLPFISKDKLNIIHTRLGSLLSEDEVVQKDCKYMDIDNGITINGRIDVLKDETVYELKFVSELSHEHYLQCACYMCMLGLEKGILWNIRDNKAYRIKIKDRDKFWKQVIKTITKGRVQ